MRKGVFLFIFLISSAFSGVIKSETFTGCAFSVVETKNDSVSALSAVLYSSGYDLSSIEELKVRGELADVDLHLMRDSMPQLRIVDLSEVHLEDNRLSDKVFMNKETLEAVKLPETLQSIGWLTFVGCKALENVDFLSCKNLQIIGKLSFSGCGLKGDLVLPPSVTTIEDYAFYGDNRLKSVRLPASLVTIGELAFKDCTQLEILLTEQVEPIALSSNIGAKGVVLQVPKKGIKAYKKAKVWKDCRISASK
ncbi:MAG: leucine-rich repeat domain-containing protein [Bacteroidales bacterium]|nr:leucine-rich repeat domain-containing protein [Bacteroidales bacterium]